MFDIKETIKNTGRANIGATYNSVHQYGIIPPPLLYADRKITGMWNFFLFFYLYSNREMLLLFYLLFAFHKDKVYKN